MFFFLVVLDPKPQLPETYSRPCPLSKKKKHQSEVVSKIIGDMKKSPSNQASSIVLPSKYT